MTNKTNWSGTFAGESLVVGIHSENKPTATTRLQTQVVISRVSGGEAWQFTIKNKRGSTIEGVGLESRGPDDMPILRYSTQHVFERRGRPEVHYTTGQFRATKIRHGQVCRIVNEGASTNFAPLVVSATLELKKK